MIAKKSKIKKSFFSPGKGSLFLAILLLFPISYLVATNLKLNQERQKIMGEMEQTKKAAIESIEKKNHLNSLLSQVSSPQALEKVAREDLNLQKPGEKILVIKREGEDQTQTSTPSQKEKPGFSFQNAINWVKVRLGIGQK